MMNTLIPTGQPATAHAIGIDGSAARRATEGEAHAFARSDPLFQQVMAYKLPPLLERLVEKEGFTASEAAEAFIDVKRFLYLCHIRNSQGTHLSPPERIDRAWHAFLLFTKQYARFCDQHFGVFIHHIPYTLAQRAVMRARGESLKTLKATIALASDAFGDLGANWMPHLLNTSAEKFASSNADCAGSTNCGGDNPGCC